MGSVARTIVGPDVESETSCRFCGVPYIGVYAGQYTCASEACTRARHVAWDKIRSLDPSRIASNRARNRAWCEGNRKCVLRRPWLLGQPPHAVYLPGGGAEIFVDPLPKWPIAHRNTRGLHGALTTIANIGHPPRFAAFALVPWPRGSLGWGVYWRTDGGTRLAGGTYNATLFDRPTTFRFGPLVRVRAPVVTKRGRHRLAIETITPVCIKSHHDSGIVTYRKTPITESILSAISHEFPVRVGLVNDVREWDRESVQLKVIDYDTHVDTIDLGSKYGRVPGWSGRVVIECNAVARWLLEAAARGPGLGAKSAFGFGRVRVMSCPA